MESHLAESLDSQTASSSVEMILVTEAMMVGLTAEYLVQTRVEMMVDLFCLRADC